MCSTRRDQLPIVTKNPSERLDGTGLGFRDGPNTTTPLALFPQPGDLCIPVRSRVFREQVEITNDNYCE